MGLNEPQVEEAAEEPHDDGQIGAGKAGLPEGEWRNVTTLWLSHSAPPDADEEAVVEAIALVMPRLTTIAQEHQGQVIQRRDGLTAVFGVPTACEDDAGRAVRAAHLMLQYLDELDRQAGLSLAFGVAVSQGPVVAGRIASRFRTEFVAEGDSLDTAQLVAERAPPGKVWVSEAVRAATERLFIYEPAPLEVRARLEDLPLWSLTGSREKPSPARGLWGLKVRFIGRERPLQEIANLAAGLSDGLGGLVWIEGEPGIGKSRLMAEFSASMEAKGIRVWSGGCSTQRSSHAFSLFSDLLRRTLNLQSVDTPDQIRRRIDQAFCEWPQDAQVTRPYLDILMGLEPGDLDREQIACLTPEQLRQQAFVALRRLFKSVADEEPLIILLDDLHWIDPMSAELLQFLIKMVTTTPILFVCAQRRQGADSPNDRLVRAQSLIPAQTVRFRLERLSASESEMLLREILPQAALPAGLRTAILKQGEGNPYFIEEFVRMLIERGYLEQRQDRWEVDPGLEISDLPLPSSLEALIRSRIDALPLELKQLLQCAAVIGEPIETTLLEASCEIPNVRAAIKRLESRLLVCQGGEVDQWNFNHSLIQAVAYSTMLKTQRKTLHLRCAQALEARWAGIEAEHADELAYHFSQADEDEKAQMYLMIAAERAAARYANEEAITYFRQIATRLVGRPETSVDLRWRVATGLGDVCRSMGKYADSMVILESGLALVETGRLSIVQQAGLYRRLGQTAQRQGELGVAQEYLVTALEVLGSPGDRSEQIEAARILFRLAWIYFYQGHFDQARQMCEDSVELARCADALNELALAENLLGGIYSHQGDWTSALHHTMRAMVLREQAGYTWGVAGSLSNMGILAVSAGHWDKAWSFFERSLALRQEMGDVEGVAIVRNNLGTLARDRGDLERAEYHFRQSLAIAKPFEISFHIANSTIGLAQVLLLQGNVADAEEVITDSLAQAEVIGAEDLLAEIHFVRAKILLAKSVWDEAKAEAKYAVSLVVETGNRSLEASCWRVASEIELARGNPQAALAELAKARQALADVTEHLEAGRIAAQAGRISLHGGQLEQAVADLESAQEVFMQLGANLDLRQVEEALEQALALQA